MSIMSEAEIAAARAQRTKLERIASANGLSFDADDIELVHALERVAYQIARQESTPARAHDGSQLATARAMRDEILKLKLSAAEAEPDLGDRVVALLRAHGGLGPISFGDVPSSQRGAAGASGDLGDQVVQRLRERGMGST